MNKRLGVIALSIAAGFAAAPVMADSTLARFDGGIGVIPVSSGQGAAATATVVNRNIVRGVQPPGQIWVISSLKAEVKDDGRIKVDGRGLLLGGGNNVGLNGNASVFATLACEDQPAPTPPTPSTFTLYSTNTAGVPLDADGDFKIDDVLTKEGANTMLLECASPVLLIRNAANRAWFAAGIPRH
jgi:hypothetical protein